MADKPKTYADTVAPVPEWDNDTATAEQFIRHNLVEALRFDTMISSALRANMAAKEGSAEYDITMQKYVLKIVTFLYKATSAELMMLIKVAAPDKADEIARLITDHLESGDFYSEMVWHWLAERNIDPDRIQDETNAAIAAKESK